MAHPLNGFESDDDDEEIELDYPIAPTLITSESTIKVGGSIHARSPNGGSQTEFQAALKDGFHFDGEFAASKRDTVAEVLISASYPVYDLGEDSDDRVEDSDAPAQDSEQSGIWEMSAEQIYVENPAWDVWIKETAGATAVMGLTASSTPARFVLRKLLFQLIAKCDISVLITPALTSSSRPASDGTEPKIGELIVILPSRHEGGLPQLQHAGQAKSFDFADDSGHLTSIVATYSGVEHRLTSVTPGCRLSLVYDILWLKPKTHPALPQMDAVSQKLQSILHSWRQDTSGSAPKFWACLLWKRYTTSGWSKCTPIPNLSAESLAGRDAILVFDLRPLARQLEFRILLAHIDFIASTDGDYEGYALDDDIEEEDFITFGPPRRRVTITQAIDLSGLPISVRLKLKPQDLINGPAHGEV
ncbi:hypothetical protein DFH09DRAFT_1428134 [Mycena vulgaris]|nr:hypothetical protein DFH09DRAFT_1428134 [Mycena vulgaris]